jgi:hypothetical protein
VQPTQRARRIHDVEFAVVQLSELSRPIHDIEFGAGQLSHDVINGTLHLGSNLGCPGGHINLGYINFGSVITNRYQDPSIQFFLYLTLLGKWCKKEVNI